MMSLNESPVRQAQYFKSFIGSEILDEEPLIPDVQKDDEEKNTGIIPS